MNSFILTRKIAASIDMVWKVAADFGRSPGPSIVVRLEKDGDLRSHGAERTIRIGNVCVRERLESVDPACRSFTYRILSGAPMKKHLARVEFAPSGTSTEIRWKVEFEPKLPGVGWILAGVTKKAINQYLNAVEQAVVK